MKTKQIIILISILFLACEKEDTEVYYNMGSPLISQVYINSELVYEYTYNELNQIVEEKSKFFYTKHNYNSKHLLSSSDHYVDNAIFSSSSFVLDEAMARTVWVSPENTEKNITNYYSYDKNKLVQRKNSRNSNYSKFNYNEGGRISHQIMYFEGKKSAYIEYLYDVQGNLIKESRYTITSLGKNELSTTTEYLFDRKHNPYKAFNSLLLPGINTNTNNIIKETYTLHFEVDAHIDKIQVTENFYEYNEKGYPTLKNGTLQYIYK